WIIYGLVMIADSCWAKPCKNCLWMTHHIDRTRRDIRGPQRGSRAGVPIGACAFRLRSGSARSASRLPPNPLALRHARRRFHTSLAHSTHAPIDLRMYSMLLTVMVSGSGL